MGNRERERGREREAGKEAEREREGKRVGGRGRRVRGVEKMSWLF